MKKTALIVGASGQDGRIAFESLATQGYDVIGIDRGSVRVSGIVWQDPVDIGNQEQVHRLLQAVQPTEIYYFAAFHQSSQDQALPEPELFEKSYRVNVFGLLHFLEGMRLHAPQSRLFYAASSLIFGATETPAQDESTPFCPDTPYGITKLDGLLVCRYYREKYGLFAAVGIFYNHESEYRSPKFISMKIVQAAVRIRQGKEQELVVGDLGAEVDWGYAPEYVEAARQILHLDHADEFVVATGKLHTVRDLVAAAFEAVGVEWQAHVREDQGVLTRKRKPLLGNPSKLKAATGWKPAVSFEAMIRKMVASVETEPHA